MLLQLPAIYRVLIALALSAGQTSTLNAAECFGTTAAGSLAGGVKLPTDGANFTPYSRLAVTLGRTYVHPTVAGIVNQSYKALLTSNPGKQFVYGETGLQDGGEFKPHKTHQNGLSVDFMVPILKNGQSVPLPTSMLNKFGYAIEFDNEGKTDDYEIDFDAMAADIKAVHEAATAQQVKIWRVIFDPVLQTKLFSTADGEYLRANLKFSDKRSWVRHDEHYHIDFSIPCEPLPK